MNINQKRGYHSPERVERANATARAILRAAETLFEAHGFAAVTMKTIAEHTGVALATVYLHFDGKAAILSALADEISSDPNLSVERVESAAGAEEQLREGVRILSALNARSWLVADILRSYSSADAGIDALRREWQRRHLEAVTRGVVAVERQGRLRADLSSVEASDILYAVAGTDIYRALVHERGWTPEAYERWLLAWIQHELVESDQE